MDYEAEAITLQEYLAGILAIVQVFMVIYILSI